MSNSNRPRKSLLSRPAHFVRNRARSAALQVRRLGRGLRRGMSFRSGDPESRSAAPKRRNAAWFCTTVAGAVALLLMLSWQVRELIEEKRAEDSRQSLAGNNSEGSADKKESEHQSEFPPLVMVDPPTKQNEPPLKQQEPPEKIKPNPFIDNNPPVAKKEPALTFPPDKKNNEPPVLEITKTKPKQPDGSPFDPPSSRPDVPPLPAPPRVIAGKEQPKQPPMSVVDNNNDKPTLPKFNFEPEKPAVKKAEPKGPFFEVKKKSTPNPFTPATKTVEKKEPDPFKPEKPKPPAVVEKKSEPPVVAKKEPKEDFPKFQSVQPAKREIPAASASAFVLELLRSESRDDSGRFLVTSVSKGDGAKRPEYPVGKPDGWNAVDVTPENNGILPVRHSVTAKTGGPISTGQQIAGSATGSANWSVSKPAIHYQIISDDTAEVGEAVAIRLLVTNTGSVDVENLTMHIDLPDALTYRTGRKLSHRIAKIEAGKTYIARLTPTAVNSGEITLTSRVFGEGQSIVARKTLTITRKVAARRASFNATRQALPRPTPRCCAGS